MENFTSPAFLQARHLAAAAIAYAEHGWRVVPLFGIVRNPNGALVCECPRGATCKKAGKHPMFRAWWEKASDSVPIAASWWRKFPNANIGIATGHGLLVLDLDPRNGSNGSMRLIETRHRPLPRTAMTRTGGGGQHLIFRYPLDRLIGGSLPALADFAGIDVVGRRHLFVAPPSRHQSGTMYEWTAAQRRPRARLTTHSLHAGVDAREHTARTPSAFLHRFRREVDPDNVLSPVEPDRRAQHALRAHMLKLVLRSARARAK